MPQKSSHRGPPRPEIWRLFFSPQLHPWTVPETRPFPSSGNTPFSCPCWPHTSLGSSCSFGSSFSISCPSSFHPTWLWNFVIPKGSVWSCLSPLSMPFLLCQQPCLAPGYSISTYTPIKARSRFNSRILVHQPRTSLWASALNAGVSQKHFRTKHVWGTCIQSISFKILQSW